MDKGIHSEDEAEAFVKEAFDIFNKLTDRQAQRIAEDDPVKKFFDILALVLQIAQFDHMQRQGVTLEAAEMSSVILTTNILI